MSTTFERAVDRVRWWAKSLTPQRLKARFDGPKVLANSVPKSGTNLLLECLSLFPMLRPSFGHVTMNSNRRAGTDELRRTVAGTKPGQYTSGHVFWSPENAEIVEAHEMRTFLMVRDPRDVVTSHFHYVTEKNTTHRLHEHYRALPDDDARLLASIEGVDGEHTRDGKPLHGIGTWMDRFLRWDEEPYNRVVRFEDLIGPRGGGDREAQIAAVESIAAHLGVTVDRDEVERIAHNTFSTGSSTFRKGLIGDWANHFTEDHVAAFKDAAGKWLLELGYEDDPDWTVPE